MTAPSEAIAHGEQAKAALDNFLSPAFDAAVKEWTARMSDIASKTPWETDKIKNLAMAVRAAEHAKGQILAVVYAGQVAVDEMRKRRPIEEMPAERRKWLGIA